MSGSKATSWSWSCRCPCAACSATTSRRKSRQNGVAARSDGLLHRAPGRAPWQSAESHAAGRCEACQRLPARSPRRRRSHHRQSDEHAICDERQGKNHRANARRFHGDSVLCLGASRAGRNGRLAAENPRGGPHPMPMPTIASTSKASASKAETFRRLNDSANRRTRTTMQASICTGGRTRERRSGCSTISPNAQRSPGGRSLLVRRHRKRRMPRAGIVETTLSPRRKMDRGSKPRSSVAKKTNTTAANSSRKNRRPANGSATSEELGRWHPRMESGIMAIYRCSLFPALRKQWELSLAEFVLPPSPSRP